MASLAQHPLNADYPFPTELPFPHQLVPVSEVTALSSLSKVLYESFLLDAKGGKKGTCTLLLPRVRHAVLSRVSPLLQVKSTVCPLFRLQLQLRGGPLQPHTTHF